VQVPYRERITEYEAGMCPLWITSRVIGERPVRKLENLYALYEHGRRIGKLRTLLVTKKVMDSDIGMQLFECNRSLEYLYSGQALALSRSAEAARKLLLSISNLLNGDPEVGAQKYGEPLNAFFTGPIFQDIDTFQISLSEELKLLPIFSVERKGNLSIESLVEGASGGYPSSTLALLDDFIKREIDEGGRCLAFSRPTASGFHILRAVEISLKGYVYAVKGALPKMNNRNWGEYISQLTDAGASSNLIDLLKILRTKRNPLMHPQDTLETEEAIGIFCICQNALETLIADVRAKGLDKQFRDALILLPTA
jgi:hypothetical protein